MVASRSHLSDEITALVVESDPLLRRLTATILRQTGYSVRESSRPEIVDAPEYQEERLELLVVGMSLAGGKRGLQVAKAVWRRNPSVKIIVTGDQSLDEDEMRVVSDAGMTFLSLPFSFGRLSLAASTPSGSFQTAHRI